MNFPLQDPPAKKPDYEGLGGRFWRITLTPNTPDEKATLAGYLLNVPGAHIAWTHYMAAIVHLRDIPGVKPAFKRYPEAEYELLVIALNPERPLPDPDKWENAYWLTPFDQVHQFHGVTEDKAKAMLETLMKGCCDGYLSPDRDYRSLWAEQIKLLIEHAQGRHEGQ